MYPNPYKSQERVRRMVRRRQRRRTAKVVTLVVAIPSLALAAAYGVDRGVAWGMRTWGGHGPARASASTSTSAPPSSTTVAGPPPCSTAQITAQLSHWQITGGAMFEIIVLDDSSGAPCSLTGYANLTVAGADGSNLPASVSDVATLGSSGGAGTSPVTMSPGQAGWFEISYPVGCTSGQCYRGATVGVLLPQATTALPVTQPSQFAYGAAMFQVGPFGSGAPPDSAPTSA